MRIFILLLLANLSHAKCLVPVDKIEEIAQKIEWQNEAGEVQNTALIQSTIEANLADDESQTEIDYEAFVRPDEDGVFQLLPIPLFVLEMKQSRNSIYICAHLDTSDEEKTEIVIYFLRHGTIKTIIPKPLPLMGLKNFFLKNLGKTPLILAALPLQITETLQATTLGLFSDLTKVGIDRVRIIGRQIELYSGGDPAQFEHYVIKKVVPF